MADQLDLMDLQIFIALVEHGGFTAAAGQLACTKQTVSRRLRELEERLGARLLERNTRAVELTEAGTRFYAAALRVMASVAEAAAVAGDEPAVLSGELRVACPADLARLILGPIVEAFLAAHPGVSVHLLSPGAAEAELSLVVGAPTGSAVRLGVLERVCVAAPALWDRCGRPPRPEALRAHPLVVVRDVPVVFAREGQSVAPPSPRRLVVTDRLLALSACRRGLGVAVLPRWLVGPSLASGELEEGLSAWALPAAELSLVRSAQHAETAAARAFQQWLGERDWAALVS